MVMDKSILSKVNILYVEDEDEVRALTVNVLSKFVKNLVEACNGKEGLDIFEAYNGSDSKHEPFDLVVTDINMPKMDGLTMLEAIGKIDNSVPSIITTAHNDADFLKKAINQRVRGYVSKPLNLHDLIDNIILAVEPKFLKDELLKANKNLESQVEEKTLELRSIIDSQENLILVMNGGELSSVNKTLLDFFDVNTLEDFKSKYLCISKLFLTNDKYFYTTNDNNWIEEIEKLDDIKRVVKMVRIKDNAERIFQVNVKSFFYNTKHFVVSLTDITELKKYTYELQYQATHDNLTKLYNRQKLNDELNKEIQRELRYGHGFSLIMFDIDDFKAVNDTYGHDIGDEVLIFISKITQKSIRSTDFASRWGGEEFMILLPETNLIDTERIAQNLRKNIENHKFNGIPKPVTISVGVATYQNNDEDKETIIKNVDIALYKAKENGKNQVVKYEH